MKIYFKTDNKPKIKDPYNLAYDIFILSSRILNCYLSYSYNYYKIKFRNWIFFLTDETR